MRDERGYALLSVLLLSALLMVVLSAYFMMTRIEQSSSRSTTDATRGFYAAEAGLNLRAEQIRRKFLGYERPVGSSPSSGSGYVPCLGANTGSGDYQCSSHEFGDHRFETYVTEDPANPGSMIVPPGESFENLSAQRYAYTVHSISRNAEDLPESILELHFNSRLVPLFQFAAFYNKDLEVHPGPPMTLAGPVHSNGDLYLGSSGGLDVLGQVTTAGSLYQGTKTDTTCYAGGVRVPNPGTLTPLPSCPTAGLLLYDQATLDSGFNGMIRTQIDSITVPEPDEFDPTPGALYWDNADARIALKIDGANTTIELRNVDGSVNSSGSTTLSNCGTSGDLAIDTTATFFNIREAKTIRMLEVDVVRALDCLHQNPGLLGGKALDEATGGGLVWYLTVDGPDSAAVNGYGVRIDNASDLEASDAAAPEIRGLTIISDQAVYTRGDFNAVDKKPAAIMADSINVLSAAYADGDHSFAIGHANRDAVATTINAAFLAGTDVTGGAEGSAGQGGDYNGGLENYPRLHESWSGVTLQYRGSFVSLNTPRHVSGPHTTPDLYSPPSRDWGFDTDFNDAANLPPLTPRFVYLKQDLFVRDFEQ